MAKKKITLKQKLNSDKADNKNMPVFKNTKSKTKAPKMCGGGKVK